MSTINKENPNTHQFLETETKLVFFPVHIYE